MRAYQLATLAAAFFSDFSMCHYNFVLDLHVNRFPALGAPAPAANPQVNYVSKYPQHPVNLGYGDNYPKYWQNKAYNPADFPPIVQPRVPFYPYPYSNAWKSTSPPTTPEEVDVKVVEQPKYTPPHGFPSSKTPAKDAIQAYSNAAQRATEEAAAAEEQPPAPRAKAAGEPSLVKEQDRGKSSKNLKFTGEGGEGDGTGYTKVINNPRKTSSKDGGNSGHSDWNQFSYGVVSDTLVHHDPYDEAPVDGERRTNAMGKIQKLLGGNGNANWYENIHKRDLDSGLEKREQGWPDHIQAKADKMMKSAAAMQDRGQTLMENDQYKAKKKEPQAAPAASAAPAPAPEQEKKKAVPGSGAKSSNKNAPQPSAAPPKKKKDDDPMMRKELPKSSGNTKKPKQPKQSRPPPPTKQKPARGGKNQKYQENSPRQQRGNAPRIQTLEKRDAAPEPAAVAGPEAVKGRSGDKVSPNKGGKNAPPPEGGKGKGGKGGKSPQQINNNDKGGKPPAPSKGPGGIRPNKINQDRPNKKNKAGAGKGKAVAMAMEEDIREHFEDDYVEDIIYEMCEAEEEEEESGLQKRQAVNRKVLPCGPPVTIRRVLGAEAAPTPAPVAVVNPVVNGPIYAAQGLGVNQIADGQVQIQAPRYQAPVQVAPVQVAPAQIVITQTVQQQVQVPGPTQYVTKAVQVPVPGPTQVVKEVVEKVVEKPVVQTVVQNVPYAVTRTQQVPYAVTQTQQVQVTQQVNVPYPVTKVQNVPYPVTQTQKVQVTQQVTKAVPYPVTQTQKVFETIVPQVKVTPKEREIIHEKEIHGSKNVVENVDVIKKVPVTRTFLVCPLCEQPEGKCSCGTFPAAEPAAAPADVVAEYKGPASGLEDVARTAKDIEAFFKAQLPEGILAQ
ncbi:hypothetical protein K440DRAFT_615623 [Wilcoxina mikolae CBS 423.85]|nr:hypothetical protein K440DRAFT_615623 [Wilcoxina mikolae CBS 423.85]